MQDFDLELKEMLGLELSENLGCLRPSAFLGLSYSHVPNRQFFCFCKKVVIFSLRKNVQFDRWVELIQGWLTPSAAPTIVMSAAKLHIQMFDFM